MKLTQEQLDIIAAAKTGESLIVEALAGSGKTYLCREIAKAVPKLSLYVAYNKAIAEEAAKSFPDNVTCKTMHSIAWGAVVRGTKYRGKLKGFLNRREITTVGDKAFWDTLGKKEANRLVEEVIEIITEFCTSPYETLRELPKVSERFKENTLVIADLFWASMVDVGSKTTIDHNTYLKLYQLGRPSLNYGLVMLDEGQDSNPCVLDIVSRQPCQKVVIGDRFQAIYAFNGAINAFDQLPATTLRLPLTQSFRFTPEVAAIALKVLRVGGYTGNLTGAGTGDTFDRPPAYLARTNSDLFFQALDLAYTGEKLYVVGGMKELFNQLYSASALKYGGKVYDKRIESFPSWNAFMTACDTQKDLAKLPQILGKVGSLHESITTIKENLVTKAKDATVVLSTCHRSKGLSLGDVTLLEGTIPKTTEFLKLTRKEQIDVLDTSQALNLIYIAITRSTGTIRLPVDVKEFFST